MFTTGKRAAGQLDVGKSISGDSGDELRQVALVFPTPRLLPGCVASATLALDVSGGRHLEDAEIAVYGSDESNYLGFAHAPNSGLDLARLVDNRPRGDVFEVSRGLLRIDVTALYRLWAAGGPFPSQGVRVERSWPFGVIVRPPAADNGTWDVFFHNSANSPSLLLSRVAGCRSSGH